ncbi:MAG TPA: UDP-N-acetylmuramoyl-tripeptide--D-alanyl-D-alanine ligase [Verrucomicrobiae bacterium]|nr:UDP-N-acetylmuramoyl-tripeptide--D-alanyl-D-alanine ligase [Verrucomicrobiae bacterium]
MRLPIHVALDATAATLFGADEAPATVRIVTDTRLLEPGDTFVALRGERYNGHDYTREAIARGAAMVVIDEPHARIEGAPAMLVERTHLAYMALARAARGFFEGQVIAITGSAGKTTTKVLLVQLLRARYGDRVLAAPANENNELGVSKLLLRATNDEHDVLVVEMGARHYGDIEQLVDIARPQFGILTNVGDAHLEIMGSRERLEETKWALFGEGARAMLNLDDAVSRARAGSLERPPHWFAARDAGAGLAIDGRVTALLGSAQLIDDEGSGVRSYEVDVRLPGTHNRANLAAALAGAFELGVSAEAAIPLLPGLRLPEGRFERLRAGGLQLVFDAYNANAAGTAAALEAFAQEPGARHIAVLASMAELGDESEPLHERTGAYAATKVDMLLVGGEYAGALARGARGAGLSSERIVLFATNGEAASWLRAHARAEDVVLLKGSRKYKLEEIVEELRR